jgi:hypothetical protein
MECRKACGACCIAPSIVQPFFGMPQGKPAGTTCVHLDEQMSCRLFGDPRRPALCDAFAPDPAVCGNDRQQALVLIATLELQSSPTGCVVP